MSKKKIMPVELRYYEMPQNENVLALLGEFWKRVYRQSVDELHFHNFLEIAYCNYGDGQVIFQNRSATEYSDGTLTIIPQNIPHAVWSYGDISNYWEFLFIDIETFLTDAYSDDLVFAHELISRIDKKAYVLKADEHQKILESVMTLMSEKRNPSEFNTEIEKCLVHTLLLRIAGLTPYETAEADHPKKQRKAIVKALEYVNGRYMEPIKINTLAEACHISETHFRRLFQETIHMTPVDYINFVRIQKACEFLKTTNDSIEYIGTRVGFVSQSTFIRNFNRFVGVAPHKWKMTAEDNKIKLYDYKITALRGW
jgi:AraC-like DNA-binding protein